VNSADSHKENVHCGLQKPAVKILERNATGLTVLQFIIELWQSVPKVTTDWAMHNANLAIHSADCHEFGSSSKSSF
jgi:hypothetical protein